MALTTIPSELSSVSGIADSSDATAITIDSSENVTFAGNILKTGDLTMDVSGDIILDADGGDVFIDDGGTRLLSISNAGSNNVQISTSISDGDLLFKGNDGGSIITALTLDMSEAGAATFNKGVTFGDDLTMPSGSNITWGTSYPALGNILNSQATILGNNIKAGATNNTVVRHANGTDAANFIAITYNKGVTFHTGITTTQNSDVAETTNERVRIDTTGKVGIGTNAPTHMLHIVDGNNYAVFGDTQSNSTMSLRMADTAARPVEVQAYGSELRFNTASSDNATPSVKMLITSAGYVGIGETSPGKALHIKGGGWQTAGITLERTDNGSANDPGITFKTAAGANDAYALGSMWFQNALDGNAYALIRARTDDASGTSGKIEFVTSTSAVGNGTTPALIIDSSGHLLPGSDSAKNLGSTSKRWDNLYVNDMHFSNEGSDGNDVDGTTGDWTLQEGEEHLYLINNKSGKKFKFSLEEVE